MACSDHSGLGTLWGPVAYLTSAASHTGTRHCVECLEIDHTRETLKTLACMFAIFGDHGERRLGIQE